MNLWKPIKTLIDLDPDTLPRGVWLAKKHEAQSAHFFLPGNWGIRTLSHLRDDDAEHYAACGWTHWCEPIEAPEPT